MMTSSLKHPSLCGCYMCQLTPQRPFQILKRLQVKRGQLLKSSCCKRRRSLREIGLLVAAGIKQMVTKDVNCLLRIYSRKTANSKTLPVSYLDKKVWCRNPKVVRVCNVVDIACMFSWLATTVVIHLTVFSCYCLLSEYHLLFASVLKISVRSHDARITCISNVRIDLL